MDFYRNIKCQGSHLQTLLEIAGNQQAILTIILPNNVRHSKVVVLCLLGSAILATDYLIDIEIDDILDVLRVLKIKKAQGPDDMNVSVLQSCSNGI